MKTNFIMGAVQLGLLIGIPLGIGARPVARAQPTVELPPAPEEPRPGVPRPPALQLPRESAIEVPLDAPVAESSTAIGGYGELVLSGASDRPNVVDMRRLVLFFGHNFTSKLRFYGELEIEHAISSAEDKGEVEVEQAFLDYLAWRPLNLRAGLLLMPVGIINIYHEPPTFNGVDRPLTDTVIIPTTWREAGAGLFGEWRGLRYQGYAVTGFDAKGFTASEGLRGGHQEAQLALGHDWGIVARLDYGFSPLYRYRISADLGVSAYFAHADQGRPEFRGSDGSHVPVSLVEGDLRVRSRGLELRAEIAGAHLGGIHRLNRVLGAEAAAAMKAFDGPVASWLVGGYVELGYNLLHTLRLRSGLSLTAFGRYEHVDTQYRLPADLGLAPGNRHDIATFGLTLRPIAEVALKLDYQRYFTDQPDGASAGADRYNVGLAFMF